METVPQECCLAELEELQAPLSIPLSSVCGIHSTWIAGTCSRDPLNLSCPHPFRDSQYLFQNSTHPDGLVLGIHPFSGINEDAGVQGLEGLMAPAQIEAELDPFASALDLEEHHFRDGREAGMQ